MKPLIALLMALTLLSACYVSPEKRYGPIGSVKAGIGYEEQILGNGEKLVSYHEEDGHYARIGLNRRASELCGGEYELRNEVVSQKPGVMVHVGQMSAPVGAMVTIGAEIRCK